MNWRIHELFDLQARKTPDALALWYGAERLTYRELNERANQLAHFLGACGVGPEVPVALCLDRSPMMIVAILAVLKAGGAYVPVDLAYPAERVSFILQDTQAPVLLTETKLRSSLPPGPARIICLDSAWTAISSLPTANPYSASPSTINCPPSTPDTAAYVIFTSGSTGKPKGVTVTHHNVTRLFRQTEPWYGFNSTDVWTLFHSYAFDFSVWEIWGALLYGGRLVIVPYETSRSPAMFYELLSRERVTVLNQTPSAFRQLIWAEATASTPLPLNLRYVIFGGEALELQSLRPWFERHGDERPLLVNMYGITETTVHVTYRPIRKPDLARGLGSVIGVPIPDLQLHLLDENLRPVPQGTPGEICVGGAGVARGYLNRPELTALRFPPDPFSRKPSARLYRSGDLAQYSPEGDLIYLGRIDNQVKIRGFRIELGEIESALNQHPGIRESAVLARDGTDGDKRLVAYIVSSRTGNASPAPDNGTRPTVTGLREHLGRLIPEYMIPSVFIQLASLPLTTHGKVDRSALPAPEGSRPELADEFLPPRNQIEKLLADIWQEVLELKNVGIHDNFFQLGGDSIRSIKILARARESGLTLTLQQLFQHPTIAELAARAQTSDSTPTRARTLPFSLISAADRATLSEEIEDAYPLTALQLGMFYHNELNPLSAVYHDVFSFKIHSAFNRAKLEEAVERLAERHPILRTSFHLARFSEPLQLVHRQVRIPFSVEDLRGINLPERSDSPPGPGLRRSSGAFHSASELRERMLDDWIEAEKRKAFDRTVAPLCRFHVQIQTDTDFQFIASFHHVCLDGWSLAAMMTEVLEDYASLLEGSTCLTRPPRACYRDFVALEKEAVSSAPFRHFWTSKLEGAAAQTLPRWPKTFCAGGHEQVRGPELIIEDSTFKGLQSLARSAGVPLKSLLLAAHQRVMASLSGQTDVISGLVCNGRPEDMDGEKILGLFLNTLPLRLQLQGGTWRDLVHQTFLAEQEVLPYRRFPLAEVQKLAGGRPLFESAFDFVHFHVYQNLRGYKDLGFMEGHYFEANNLTTYTTFMLNATSTQLQMHIDYDPKVIARQQIEQISAYYLKTLQVMASMPDSRYEAFSPLSDSEARQMLAEWNATEEDYPRTAGLHQLFEARAEETPDAIAIRFGTETLTYRELNQQAALIADHLVEIGVRPGSLVGICLDRGPEMVASLLAILKSGAAYLPLDPAFPHQRFAFMLEDSKASLLLTQRKLLALLPQTGAQVLCIDAPESSSTHHTSPITPSQFNQFNQFTSFNEFESLAYVIYTSGSTGTPKGVQITHRAVVNLLTSAARKAGVTKHDNLLAVTTLSFDIAALELFLPLITGGQLTIASRETASDGHQLAALIESSAATIMQATPATWRLLLESGWPGSPNLKIFCGGEALKRDLADELLRHAREVWNFYGPTETTIWSTAWKVAPGDPVLIGRPLANTQLYILDQHLQPVPVGAIGELHIGGDGLARGYLNRCALTAEKFILNPFAPTGVDAASERLGSRLYKTGDLARYLPDGTIECLGRIDHQVKIHGFRIELGEIEAVLRQHGGIADAVVIARENALGEKQLVGYVINRNGPLSTAQLREFIQTKLPHYMVPAHLVAIDRFPHTPNGKIDLRQLPSPETSREPSRDFVPPHSEVECQLAGIWQEVLQVKQIGVFDNFFESGADSLSATRAFARINKIFGTNLRLPQVFEHPTISALAEIVQRNRDASPALMPIPRQPRALSVV